MVDALRRMSGTLTVLLMILGVVAAAPAVASTTVTGATDSSVPLTIDPSGTVVDANLDLGGSPKVGWVAPKVDRVVSAVTVGDLRSRSDCTTTPRVGLQIYEHPHGDYFENPDLTTVSSKQFLDVPVTASRLTFSFSPVWLRAGRGYVFVLTWGDTSKCRYVVESSWAHNGSQVDSGSSTCQPTTAFTPALPGSGAPSTWRMYHWSGSFDRVPDCDNSSDSSPSLSADMPPGWLMTVSYNGSSRSVSTPVQYPGQPPVSCNGGYELESLGVTPVYWHDNPDGSSVYVCRFGQFAAPGDRVADGWYYGLPWLRSANSSPRDVYLKLEYRPADGAAPADFPAGPTASELNGSGNPAAPNLCSCRHADPVDSATGNLTETETDLSIPGRGLFGLPWTRSYNSQAAQTATSAGPMGYGWSATWTDRLSKDATTGVVTIGQANGSTVSFTPVAWSTGFAAPPWVQASLSYSSYQGRYTYTLGDGTRYVFDTTGKLVSVTDRVGVQTTLGYDASGRLTSVSDAGGRVLTVTPNSDGTIAKVTTPAGRHVDFSYTNGNLTGVHDLRGQDWVYTYDSSHRLTGATDPRGHASSNTYDASGRVIAQTDRAGHTWGWSYAGGVTTVTDPLGHVSEEEFSHNLLVRQTVAKGTSDEATSTFGYDSSADRVRVTDPDGHDWTASYSPAGDRLSSTDPSGRTTRYGWDSAHHLLSQLTPGGQSSSYVYDSSGNVTSVTRRGPTGPAQKTSFTYSYGHVTARTDPLGRTWSYGYTAQGDRSSAQTPSGSKTTWTTNADGQITSVVSPRGNVTGADPTLYRTSIDPDPAGLPQTITDPLGRVTAYAYDANGNATAVTDAANHTTTTVYDALDRPIEVHRPDGVIESTAYTATGQIASQTDGKAKVTDYDYDAQDRPVAVTDPLNRTRTMTYSPGGRLLTEHGPDGHSSSFSYDASGRQTAINYGDPGTPDETFAYDPDGHLTQTVDATGTSTLVYDSLGRLASHTDAVGGTVAYSYDLGDQITKISYPGSGRDVTRSYDNDGRLTGVTDWSSRAFAFAYDPDGNLTSRTYPSASTLQDQLGYDRAGALTAIALKRNGSTYAELDYDRDPLARLSAEHVTGLTGQSDTTFGYDSTGRLSSANTGSYTYDDAGNPLSFEGATAAQYDPARELTQIDRGGQTTTFDYDALGRRTAAHTATDQATYAYDQADRLTSATPSGSTQAATYAYDATGLRASRTRAGATAHYRWDRTAANALLLDDGTHAYVYGPGGDPLEQIAADNTATLLHTDQLGSVRVLSDTTGTTTGTASYTPYGKPDQQTGTSSDLGYAGQLTDPATGLIYLRARDYDPATAAFLTRDPLEASTRDPYSYTSGDPVNNTDPSGLCSIAPWSSDSCLAKPAAEALDGITGGISTMIAAKVFGFDADCTGWGNSGIAQAAGLIGFGKFGREARLLEDAAKGGSALADASASAFRAADDPASIFIKNKHLASSGIRGGKFATDDIGEAQSLVAEALRSEGAMFLPNQLDETFRVVADLGRAIGTRGETRVRAIVTNDGRVINAFPVRNR